MITRRSAGSLRVAGVGDAAAAGVDHGDAADAHGELIVSQSPLQEVLHGLRRVLAGRNLAVGVEEVFGSNVEFGPVLAGERGLGAVLADRARAQGDGGPPADGPGQILIRGRDRVGEA